MVPGERLSSVTSSGGTGLRKGARAATCRIAGGDYVKEALLRYLNTDYVAGVQGGSHSNGAHIVQWAYLNHPDQYWYWQCLENC
jgi:hypothetical protein